MKKTKAKAITFGQYYHGKPPREQPGIIDAAAEKILQMTGLRKSAREKLSSRLFAASGDFYVQYLHALFNDVADGGLRGLITSFKVCFCLKN